MLNYFYDKTCTIERVTFTSVSGWSKPVMTTTYTDIPCAFWAVNKTNLQDAPEAQEVDKKNYTANLQGQYTDVRLWDYLTLKDKTWISLWKFLVIDTIQYPDLRDNIDNIALTIKRYDG